MAVKKDNPTLSCNELTRAGRDVAAKLNPTLVEDQYKKAFDACRADLVRGHPGRRSDGDGCGAADGVLRRVILDPQSGKPLDAGPGELRGGESGIFSAAACFGHAEVGGT
ncbi:hypothetical protein [Nocardiopsis valliformis]|uniref:hypothetical protein n=1 Tax=Nocardiopsis valliformis TaxID=239974 RepID=UPI001268603F|nr:hypothetical protein [Nocardiopsis valliformis]